VQFQNFYYTESLFTDNFNYKKTQKMVWRKTNRHLKKNLITTIYNFVWIIGESDEIQLFNRSTNLHQNSNITATDNCDRS
jgi:hypothetical protein